jgi:hypothetical protein
MRDGVELLEKVIHYAAAKSDKEKSLEKILPKILDEVIRLSPQHTVEKYIASLLNGEWGSVAIARNVESPEYFFTLVTKTLRGIILARKVPQVAEPFYRKYADFSQFDCHIKTGDLVKLLEFFNEGYDNLKRYVVDSQEALDNTAIKVAHYTSELPRREKKSEKKSTSGPAKGSLLEKRFGNA